MIQNITPTLTICDDNALIIEHMKKSGVYDVMQEKKNSGKDSVIFTKDGNAFIWSSVDSGYVHIKANTVSEKIQVFMLITGVLSGHKPVAETMH